MKERVQRLGRFLSGMVMPNIGAFLAWGLIMALFMPNGWCPDETIAGLVSPMAMVLFPLLIAYAGGSVVDGQRGGVAGAVAVMGLVADSDIPMILGAMVIGPASGWVMKQVDRVIEGRARAGFEMLVNNFSLGITGAVLAVIVLKGFMPPMRALHKLMESGLGFVTEHGLIPLASVFIESSKFFFLNNAVNHGILTPVGIWQAEEIGKSVLFLLDPNPGPGLGILLAYCIAGRGSARSSAPGAVIIHLFGGIHEIYFPYMLMNPFLLIAGIMGGAVGGLLFAAMDAGLTAPASPGSILSILAMTPKGDHLAVIAGVLVSTIVSFAISLPILKFVGRKENLEESHKKVPALKQGAEGLKTAQLREVQPEDIIVKAVNKRQEKIRKIAFACDAGMGSSAMGATVLRRKMTAAGLEGIEVVYAPVSSIPPDAQIVLTHHELGERASKSNPDARLILIQNFLAAPEYDALIKELKQSEK